MPTHFRLLWPLLPLLAACLVSEPRSQGEFVNFEVPQVKPIDVATVGSGDSARDFLLVCNTPDNSVEIYEADPPHAFVDRVPVGMGPVTVRYQPDLGKLFTCNFTGDSVSVVRLEPGPGGSGRVQAVLEQTTWVGDEPSDIAFLGKGALAVITLSSKSGATIRWGQDLGMLVPPYDLVYDEPSGLRFGVKLPRMIQSLPHGRVFVLNFMGDHKGTQDQLYDLDLLVYDPSPGDPNPYRIAGGLGTTNHSFAVNHNASKTFVVGTRAQNLAAEGADAVSRLETGFVQSHLWVLDSIPGTPPEVVPEAPAASLPAPLLRSINLNRDYSVDELKQVPPGEALSQPTDVLVLEDPGSVARVGKLVITAFHSNKVAILTPDSSVPGGWRITRIPVPVTDPSYGTSGPRGLAFSRNATDPGTPDSPGLVFCANGLDNSVSVINPHTEAAIGRFRLQNDPTPDVIRRGRQFLYDASRFSGSGMVACASCHIDGRTDGLSWNLGTLNTGPSIPPGFHDGSGQTLETMPEFPADKGRLVTKTLQGLVNSRVNPEMQMLFSNAPYHWRGDRQGLTDFNEAFVSILGMENLHTPEDPKGIDDADMMEFARFVETIAHPPNPEQVYDRRNPGSLGDDPDDPNQGSGALLGLKLYHIQPIVPNRSCVQCHALPDGSGNTSSLVAFVPATLGNQDQAHPLETAETRNLFQREMLLHHGFGIPTLPLIQTANYGLLHTGDPQSGIVRSINEFVGHTFLPVMPGATLADRIVQVEALIEFIRRLDTGIAPAVGFAWTFVPGHPLNATIRWILEEQVSQANIGLAVHTFRDGRYRGFYYDLTASPPGYREVRTRKVFGHGYFDDLVAGSPDARVVLQATPVGSERRIADPEGISQTIDLRDTPPTGVTLEAMAPATHWVEVTSLTANLETPSAPSMLALRTLQDAVVGPEFGIASIRHHPPRRFRVSGQNIRPNAILRLGVPDGDSPRSLPVRWLEMPIFPTMFDEDGRPIWETTAEADATVTMALLNGGPWAPGVDEVLLGQVPPSEPLDPAGWNWFLVEVLNEDGTTSSPAEWQRLRVQDHR